MQLEGSCIYSAIIAAMENDTHQELKELIQENTDLLKQNATLLRKIYRNEIIGIWIKIIWLVLLIGLPFFLYFYFLEPYFTALGSSYETFSAGMLELPIVKYLLQFIEAVNAGQI